MLCKQRILPRPKKSKLKCEVLICEHHDNSFYSYKSLFFAQRGTDLRRFCVELLVCVLHLYLPSVVILVKVVGRASGFFLFFPSSLLCAACSLETLQ